MKKSIFKYIFWSVLVLVGTSSCKSLHSDSHVHAEGCEHDHAQEGAEHDHAHDQEHAHDHASEHDHPASESEVAEGNTITFSEALQGKVQFTIETVSKEPFGSIIRTVSQVQPWPGDEIDVIAKADGVVEFPSTAVSEGSKVGSGERVLYIECGGLADNNIHTRYAEVTNTYNMAKSEYERKKPLHKEKIVSETEYRQAQTAYENARIAYEHLRKNFSEDRQVVKSPINGYLKDVMVRNGQFVSAGQRLFTVTQNRKSFLRAEVSPKYYEQLKQIASATFRNINGTSTYKLSDLKGRLVSFGRSTSLENPLLPIVFEIESVEEWIPGTFVETYIQCSSNKAVITVRNEAIVEEMGNYFVFVQLCTDLFEKRMISKGATNGLKTEVLSGLSEGEKVVGKGAVSVKLAQGSAALDPHSGHAH